MLERNANPIDTFEGVLSRRDVRTLKLLVALGEEHLKRRTLRANIRPVSNQEPDPS